MCGNAGGYRVRSMRISEAEKQLIVQSFQRLSRNIAEAREIADSYELEQLKQTDEMIGEADINSGYRIALRDQIEKLDRIQCKDETGEGKTEQGYETRLRIWNLAAGIVIGLIIALISVAISAG